MPIILLVVLLSILVSISLTIMSFSVGKKSKMSREKLTSFECGFDSKKKARAPFSLRFFMVTILFLIFDVEITILLPLGFLTPYSDPMVTTFTAMTLALTLIVGLVHEWNQGCLAWTK